MIISGIVGVPVWGYFLLSPRQPTSPFRRWPRNTLLGGLLRRFSWWLARVDDRVTELALRTIGTKSAPKIRVLMGDATTILHTINNRVNPGDAIHVNAFYVAQEGHAYISVIGLNNLLLLRYDVKGCVHCTLAEVFAALMPSSTAPSIPHWQRRFGAMSLRRDSAGAFGWWERNPNFRVKRTWRHVFNRHCHETA